KGLETEGLFRVSASQKSINRLKSSLEMELLGSGTPPPPPPAAAVLPSENVLVAPRDIPPSAAVVKMFLRELPQPLIPKDATQLFVDALLSRRPDGEQQGTGKLRELVIALPTENFATLKYLMEFLAKVAAKQEKNFMSEKSLGMVFAPCLFSLGDAMEMMAASQQQQQQQQQQQHHHHHQQQQHHQSPTEVIDLPLAKKLCEQTQEVVVALINDCDKIFAPIPDRPLMDLEGDCEELFLKCRPPPPSKRVSASPEAETILETDSNLIESVDEVTVIEADPEVDDVDDEVVVVVVDDDNNDVDIDSKRAMERMEEIPAFRSSRPLTQIKSKKSGRHHHSHHHHSSPSKRPKKISGSGSGPSSDSSCSSFDQNDQENREPNLGQPHSSSPSNDNKSDETNEEKEIKVWQASMDLDDPPVVAQRAVQSQDEVMFSPRSSFLIPREEENMKQRAADNRTSDHDVRRRDAKPCSSFDDDEDDDYTDPASLPSHCKSVVNNNNNNLLRRRASPPANTRRKNDPAYQAATLIRRRASKLKRKLVAEEEVFMKVHGVKPSKADKMISTEMRALVVQLRQCKAELKRLVDDPSPATALVILAANSAGSRAVDFARAGLIKAKYPAGDLEKTVSEIDEHLRCLRETAMVYLESKHGRPGTPEDKKIVWTLYDRYRAVKRTIVRLGMSKPNTNLIPIPEHVAMEFPKTEKLPVGGGNGNNGAGVGGTQVADVEAGSSSSGSNGKNRPVVVREAPPPVEIEFDMTIYHEGPIKDLERMQRSLIERRKELKRQIRIFEVGFEDNNGRPPRSEEERSPMDKTYRAYKEVKARMRLVEALIQKQEKTNPGNATNNTSKIVS
ncbi:unnamed protein product, partial [Notodromas monacha]